MTTDLTDTAIKASVRALADKQWNPYFERSAHVHHTHNADCAICMGALDMIAGVVLATVAPLIVAAERERIAREHGPYVWAAPGRLGGKPCIGGHRIDAVTIARLVYGDGGSTHLALAAYPQLTRAEVLTACWYLGSYGAPVWRDRWGTWTDQHENAMWNGRWNDVPDPPNAMAYVQQQATRAIARGGQGGDGGEEVGT